MAEVAAANLLAAPQDRAALESVPTCWSDQYDVNFSERSFDGVGVDAIGKEAGVGWVTTTKPKSSLDDAALCRDRGNTERSLFAIGLRNIHTPNRHRLPRARHVGPRGHGLS
jgi:hypothetical protein